MELVRARQGHDAATRFHHAVSRAFFAEGADISDLSTIAGKAEALGVTADEVERAWREHAFAGAVDASIAASREAGVRGVPAYGWPGTRATSGMMEPELIVDALRARPAP